MTMIAYAFLQYRRLKTARRKKKNQRAAAATDIARRGKSIFCSAGIAAAENRQ
jgi:hypothetical protein